MRKFKQALNNFKKVSTPKIISNRFIKYSIIYFFSWVLLSCVQDSSQEQPMELITHHTRANELYQSKQYTQSLTAYQQAIKIYQTQNQWQKVWQCNNRIVQCYTQNAAFTQALALAKKNLELCCQKRYSLPDFVICKAATQRLIAQIFSKTFHYDKATKAFEQVLKTYLQHTDQYFSEAAQVYNALGNLHLKKLAYSTAFEYHQKALTLLQQHLNTANKATLQPMIAQTYNSIGMTYGEQGDFDTAIGYYQKSLKLKIRTFGNSEHADLAAPYNNIGINYYLKGEYETAQKYLLKAIEIRERVMGKGFHTVAGFYNNLAHIYLDKKEYQLSLKYFNAALHIRQKKQGLKNPLVAQSYIFLGNVYTALKQPEQALKYYHKSLYINSKQRLVPLDQLKLAHFTHHRFLFEALGKLSTLMHGQALTQAKQVELINTLAFIKNNVALLDAYIRTLYNKKDKIIFNKQLTLFCTQAIDILYQMAKLAPARRQLYQNEAFYFAERNKASVLSASLAEVDARRFANIPTDLLSQEQVLRQKVHFYNRKLLKSTGKQQQAYLNTSFETKRKYEQFVQRLEKDYPQYYHLKYKRRVASIKDVQQVIQPHEALLQYITGPTRSYVFVITQQDAHLIAIAPTKKLLPTIKAYYRKLQGGYPIGEFSQASNQAYQVLMAPLQPYLSQKTRLTVIPDWRLAKLPLSALITQLPRQTGLLTYSQLQYLIKDYEINCHYSASIWVKRPKTCAVKSLDFVAFAPFSEGTGKVLTTRFMSNALPASKIEVNTVLNMFKQEKMFAQAYLSEEASKNSFLAKSSKARIVHIASHSIYDRTNEKLARIYFSKNRKNGKEEDNYLLTGDIYNLRLCADLVVLSSCESGLGKSYKGEGMMSLTRSFLYAGARNIVFSLWRVNDRHTKNLMIRFYKAIVQQKMGFAQALQQAKQEIIAQQKHLHPKDWSGFAIVGH